MNKFLKIEKYISGGVSAKSATEITDSHIYDTRKLLMSLAPRRTRTYSDSFPFSTMHQEDRWWPLGLRIRMRCEAAFWQLGTGQINAPLVTASLCNHRIPWSSLSKLALWLPERITCYCMRFVNWRAWTSSSAHRPFEFSKVHDLFSASRIFAGYLSNIVQNFGSSLLRMCACHVRNTSRASLRIRMVSIWSISSMGPGPFQRRLKPGNLAPKYMDPCIEYTMQCSDRGIHGAEYVFWRIFRAFAWDFATYQLNHYEGHNMRHAVHNKY